MANEKRLIDANMLCDGCSFKTQSGECIMPFCKVRTLPAVDVVEAIHAYWMYADELDESGDLQAYCSNCMALDLHAPRKKNDVPYCWRCGAKMDGDGNA